MTLHALTVRGIPAPLLKALKAAARRNRRSLNAEVLVRLEAGVEPQAAPVRAAAAGGRASVREAEGTPYEVRRAFEEADLARLRSDLALTPEQRVHLGEELARVRSSGGPRPPVRRVLQFDSYEDYLDWKRVAERVP